jgi:hypothetical protein
MRRRYYFNRRCRPFDKLRAGSEQSQRINADTQIIE